MRAVAPHAGAWIEISLTSLCKSSAVVAPHAGAWIEISLPNRGSRCPRVAPHAGAWIEILSSEEPCRRWLSRPTRARGLKCAVLFPERLLGAVAPHAGAWIEIAIWCSIHKEFSVAPHAGAWIEMQT